MTERNNQDQGWQVNIEGLPEQIDAITSLAHLTVVSAGAGTGKTQTLSQRFAWLLANDKNCCVDEILVLTFTEKAAREMQDRIKKTITEWCGNSGNELPHLKQGLLRIDDAYISTIHSFAMKVIRESGLLLNIDPAAGIAPKPKEELWWEYFSEAIGTMSAERLKHMLPEDWNLRVDILFSEDKFSEFVTSYGPSALAKAAKNASEKLGSYGKSPDDLWNQSLDNLLHDIHERKTIFIELWNLWQDVVFPSIWDELHNNPGNGCFLLLKDIALEYYDKKPTEENIHKFAVALLSQGLGKLPGGKPSKLKSELETVLGCQLLKWRNEAKMQVSMATEPSVNEIALSILLNRTCALGWQCWESLRQQQGILSNNDLIRYAGDVLKKNQEYGTKFKHILIDEFQDTDGLQEKLISSLWREGQNTLFLVGDVKQSIYRFRHADLMIFQKYIQMAKKCNDGLYHYITLDKSFRTRDELLEKFNYIFEDTWKNGIEDGTSMSYEPLRGADSVDWWKLRNKECQPPVLQTIVAAQTRELRADSDGKEEKWYPVENKAEIRNRLYRELAAIISDLHILKAKIWDKDIKGEDKFRNVLWRDFAVLVPTRTVYNDIERVFEEVKIPYVLCTSKDYFSRGEVADLVNFISMLAQPDNPLYLAGWLCAPFSGVDPDIAQACLDAAYTGRRKREPIPLYEIVEEKLPEIITEIVKLKTIAELSGVSEAILEISKCQNYLKAYDSNQRRKVNANIVYLSDLAEEYEMSEGRSLQGCANYLQFAVNEAKRIEEPDVIDEDQDAVKILTIHASKGLEFPIVALSGVEECVSVQPGLNVSVRYGLVSNELPDFLTFDGDKNIPTVVGLWHKEAEKKATLAERERFWYVASTRAREKLILCGTVTRNTENNINPPHTDSFLSEVLSLNEKLGGISSVSYLVQGVQRPIAKMSGEKMQGQNIRLGLNILSQPKLARLSASAYAMISWCPMAYRTAYRQGRNMIWTVKGEDISSGSEFGSLAHWIMARWDFRKDSLESWLPEFNSQEYKNVLKRIPFELKSEFNSNSTRAEITKMLSEFSQSNEGINLARLFSNCDSRIFQRETPFRVQDGDLLLVGATDILWEDKDGLHLRDWKTTAEELAPRVYYEEQLLFYGYSIWKYRQEKKFKDISISAGINYLRSDSSKRTNIILTNQLLMETGQKIHSAAEKALTGLFEKNYEHCEICPWSNLCVK